MSIDRSHQKFPSSTAARCMYQVRMSIQVIHQPTNMQTHQYNSEVSNISPTPTTTQHHSTD